LREIADALEAFEGSVPAPFAVSLILQPHPDDDAAARLLIDAVADALGATAEHVLMLSDGSIHYETRQGDRYGGLEVRAFHKLCSPGTELQVQLATAREPDADDGGAR
jgi:hypothetical protein